MVSIIFRYISLLAALVPIELNVEARQVTLPPWHYSNMKALSSENSSTETEKLFLTALENAKSSNQLDRYPEESVLTSRASSRLSNNNLTGAEDDYSSALALAEKSLDYIWTERIPEKDRDGYLPAYSTPSDERAGKNHRIANLHNGLAEVKFHQNQMKLAQEHLNAALRIITTKLPPNYATAIEISCYKLQGRIFEKQGNLKEAQIWKDKAAKLDVFLDK